ncbi:hypothetical protein [Mycobacterium sp. NPDC006124]|uniref:hypothetical protein n=1 Tax=Mycobacterium sp. NPDC006124 TaxID=3156729 RepID=UPI0033BBBFFA
MGLFDRAGGASVVVTPGVVTPRQTVQATITTDEPLAKVRSARLDWGYLNFYQYHWAGRVDSVAAQGNDTVWTAGQVGTNYGGDRDTDDWVSVVVEDLPIATGEFSGASSTFRIPSWAPASAPEIARWECRLTVDRDGRDAHARGEFTVQIGTGDVDSYLEPLERVSGNAETVLDLELDKPVWRAGETVIGRVTLTPTVDLPDGDLAVSWQRERESHPLTRTPGPGTQLDGRIVQLDKNIRLRAGTPVSYAFQVALPDDAPPTAAAVHSSVNWFLQARLMYRGFNGHLLERVRRPITVVNAP